MMQRWTGDIAYQYQYNEISREAVNITKLPDNMIILEPGFYQFEYNDVHSKPPSGFYGRSKIFEVDVGNHMVILVWVESAI
ncbi:MAG: hypothetical protein DRH24_11910 [Deltaproteobacteria bacterium]|nr:MAG: hypothetical protein DRH24_11910 [Deltaproteobacteria bacterium]